MKGMTQMKFNEYELSLTKGKLSLKVKQQFDTTIEYIDDVLAFLLKQYNLLDSAIEKSFVLAYDVDGKLIGLMQIGLGDFRDVNTNLNSAFKFLLLSNAMGCIFVHNHPVDGLELMPSTGDYEFTNTVTYLCDIFKIDMLADVILQGRNEYYNITHNGKMVLTHDW